MDILQLVIQFGPAVVKAMGYKNEDVDAAVESMTSGGFSNMFTGGEGVTALLKDRGKKFLGNQAFKALTGSGSGGLSSIMGPGLLMGGAMMLGRAYDPTREGSRNYNPALRGQIDYALSKGLIGRNRGSGLEQYSNNSVLSGQNVKSLFGTNDYATQLQNHIDKYGDKDGTAQQELDNLNIASQGVDISNPNEMKNVNGGNDGGNNSGQSTSSSNTNSPGHPSNRADGGIMKVNMNRGRLGETLYG